MSFEYPNLDPRLLAPLRIIQANLALEKGYLDEENCPYSPDLREFLRVFTQKAEKTVENASEIVKKPNFLGLSGNKWAALETEVADLYQELKDFSATIKDGDVSERMAYFRTATALLEKIVSINERAMGLKHVSDFHQLVLSIFEAELSVDQRTTIMARLRASIDNEVPHE